MSMIRKLAGPSRWRGAPQRGRIFPLTSPPVYVPVMFMNSAPAFDAQATKADPGVDRQTDRLWQVLGLVQALIEYGKQLVTKIRQGDIGADITRHFGTIDIALILSRITRGLQLAVALEDRLADRLDHPPAVRAATGTPSARRPRASLANNPRAGNADTNIIGLPTAAEIAAQVRRRPIGAVLADICRDLGIVASDPLWRELSYAIIVNNGNLAALVKDMLDRLLHGAFDGFDAPVPCIPAASASGAGLIGASLGAMAAPFPSSSALLGLDPKIAARARIAQIGQPTSASGDPRVKPKDDELKDRHMERPWRPKLAPMGAGPP